LVVFKTLAKTKMTVKPSPKATIGEVKPMMVIKIDNRMRGNQISGKVKSTNFASNALLALGSESLYK